MCYNNNYKVPEPILFNCLKHHAGYISEFIMNYDLPMMQDERLSSPELLTQKKISLKQLKRFRLETKSTKESTPDFPKDKKESKVLIQKLAIIGKSQMDLYTGKLSPLQIAEEITCYLQSTNLIEEIKYFNWVRLSVLSYRETRLSDNSLWVLLPGKIAGRHVHIHPARYSPYTIRVRSETLKTAIAVLCYSKQYKKDHSDPSVINKVRKELLDLSPVKDVDPERGLGKMLEILTNMPR